MNKQETNSTDKILEIKYSKEDIKNLQKSGVSEDELPKNGVKKYRRSRFVAKPSESKVKITMWIDGDVLQHFKKRSESSDSAPYQTQINAELRRIMEKDLESEKIKESKTEDISKDKEFIRAVAEQLKELVA